jgi:CysZ protein
VAAVASKRAALGFFSGVKALFGGIGFVVGRPSAWGWALIPVAVATLLFVGLAALAISGGAALTDRIVDPTSASALAAAGSWALKILFWIVGLVLAFVVAISFAQPLSGFALDAIARKQELALGGRTWPDQPVVASALRSLRVSLTALAVSLPLLALLALVTFLVPPASVVTVPLKFLVTGLTVAYDFIDYPIGLRGGGVADRAAFMKRNFSAVLGFGVAAAAVLLIPGVGLFLLPFGVAGATRLVVAGDART